MGWPHEPFTMPAEAYAACFAEDGVLELDRPIAGREAIRAWMTAPSVIPQREDAPRGFISHHITSVKLTLTAPDRAGARVYFLVTSPVGLDHNGYYDDRYVCEGGQWLIAHRKPRTLWFAPDSLVRKA
ncbi:MAG TPA: nuclear transport factor 2 family protein [Novosphingobium sp.]|nr:nuclear transport factor 2 family protein [Novosphingobium sp.]